MRGRTHATHDTTRTVEAHLGSRWDGWGPSDLALVILVIQADRHPRVDHEVQVTSTKLDLALQPLATGGGDQPRAGHRERVLGPGRGRGRTRSRVQGGRRSRPLPYDRRGDHRRSGRPPLSHLAADWRVLGLSSDGAVESAQYTKWTGRWRRERPRRQRGGGKNERPTPDTLTEPAPESPTIPHRPRT